METEVISEDRFGAEAYKDLFNEIMSDIGKAFQIERSLLVLKPDIPFFVFSVRLKTEPSNKTIADVANIREDSGKVHITISEEMYAPAILDALWSRYGKDRTEQQTRFDIELKGTSQDEIGKIEVASGEEYLKEIVGSIWRSLPEGIRVRHAYITGTVITIVATEEIFKPEMLEEGLTYHVQMGGSRDV